MPLFSSLINLRGRGRGNHWMKLTVNGHFFWIINNMIKILLLLPFII